MKCRTAPCRPVSLNASPRHDMGLMDQLLHVLADLLWVANRAGSIVKSMLLSGCVILLGTAFPGLRRRA